MSVFKGYEQTFRSTYYGAVQDILWRCPAHIMALSRTYYGTVQDTNGNVSRETKN